MIAIAIVLACGIPCAFGRNATFPRYCHIFIIIAENRGFDRIIHSPHAPVLNRLARRYGLASRFYAEIHPSEANYIAMIGGDTFGIHDDDAWCCQPGSSQDHCGSAATKGYPDHTIRDRSLIGQLNEHGLTWKGYFESIPAPASPAVFHPTPATPIANQPNDLYAAKHNGFMNFSTARNDPHLGRKLVGFDQLHKDLASGDVPNYAHIVPNQCNDMHGPRGPNVPADCESSNVKGLIARGDAAIGALVEAIQASPVWSGPDNAAVVITWDEDNHDRRGPRGYRGFDPKDPARSGGGHIPTLVITNHGPRGVVDDTHYNHDSLLHTTEAAFGITEYLKHANDSPPMLRLFRTR